jgi:hypothetical protein
MSGGAQLADARTRHGACGNSAAAAAAVARQGRGARGRAQCLMSAWTTVSEKRRPMSRLASKMVFTGFIALWFFAASPIMRSVSVNATHDGVVRLPWSFAMISTRSFCQMPTHE